MDPLDGTKEFLSQNGTFSIMIGLVEDDEPVFGVVYLSDGDVLYSAARGQDAWVECGGERLPLRCREADGGPLRLVGSRSHIEPLLARMQEVLGITDVASCNSVGVKCGRIVEGDRDLYVHPVPYWDTCAPEVILREVGGSVTECRGDRLVHNKPDPRQPHEILACAPGTLERVLEQVHPLYKGALTISAV